MPLLHGTLHVTLIEAISLPKPMVKGKDTYVTIKLQETKVGRTRCTRDDPVNPKWDESLHIYCAHFASRVVFSIKRKFSISKSIIGVAFLNVTEKILNGQEVDTTLPISCGNKNAKVHVKLQFVGVNQDQNWTAGIPRTFFPQRHGCKVTLYQDAHVPDNFLREISLAGVKNYEPNRCWEDMFDAITNAKKLIYIIGWSVSTKITLIRDSRRPREERDKSLGNLLKERAKEGVTVLMLLWRDKSSLIGVHDKETRRYFKDTGVKCVLCPRLSITSTYTHHQKTVVVDSALPSGGSEQRGITSFLGGIDLCNGRYDTQVHSLFRTLDSEHRDDFYQGNIKGASSTSGDPRQPWHDIHCRLDGPVAWDVLDNFEQRWRKQGGDKSLLVQRTDLVKCPVTSPNDDETWNVQLFRSIDGDAVDFVVPESSEVASTKGLVRRDDNIIDRSIQDGYINAIRRAKKFIYIENQYFLGSSFCWRTDGAIYKNPNVLNLIPKELSLKIINKIKAGERFAVYIVLPMWPEGLPEGATVQAILDGQRRTMDSMYSDIANGLKANGIQAEPKDYLSFFCLGNREVSNKPKPDTGVSRAQKARRSMIYVHSKMMIVDDKYIIIGSANINERSLDGARDTEIAIGGYQPRQLARGQIHGFRMALWYEHIGMLDDLFLQPESVDCVHHVNEIAKKYWKLYRSDNLDNDLPGHLLSHPILIGENFDEQVEKLRRGDFFPDTNVSVLGRQSEFHLSSMKHNEAVNPHYEAVNPNIEASKSHNEAVNPHYKVVNPNNEASKSQRRGDCFPDTNASVLGNQSILRPPAVVYNHHPMK